MISKVKCNFSRQGCGGRCKVEVDIWDVKDKHLRLALFWRQHHIDLISHTQETINMRALVSICHSSLHARVYLLHYLEWM